MELILCLISSWIFRVLHDICCLCLVPKSLNPLQPIRSPPPGCRPPTWRHLAPPYATSDPRPDRETAAAASPSPFCISGYYWIKPESSTSQNIVMLRETFSETCPSMGTGRAIERKCLQKHVGLGLMLSIVGTAFLIGFAGLDGWISRVRTGLLQGFQGVSGWRFEVRAVSL